MFVAAALSDGSEEASRALAGRVAAIAESRAAAEAAPKKAPNAAAGGRADTETRAAAQPRAVKAWAWAARFEARMMKLEDKLDATAAGGGRAAARALAAGGGDDDASPGALGRIEERLARIEETLQDVAARP